LKSPAHADEECPSLDSWQIEEITNALAEADRADFASDDEVELTFKKWTLPHHL
jgi:predicted transcriptional regulator